ncbi:circadian clock-controlled protein-like [Scaptodrosophila lebanonensis]|uniref:Circadian clock-controlled protein-like n=1 Tax=Drosophila lebanonensis TaxID=7225 RepID=A0A6J2TDC6_DROLE|nr:circadian clock-controlled protein-like [Scaptodrosophila lebanonensis]
MHTFSLLIIFLNFYPLFWCQMLPASIKKCRFGDTICIADTMNYVIRNFPKGIPEIGLKPLDAVSVKDVLLVDDAQVGVAWFQFKLIDQINYGFENTTITQIKGFDQDPTSSSMEIYGTIPSLTYKGQYIARGRMLWLVDVNATGESESDFQNFRFSLKLKVIPEYRYNKTYIKIYELVPDINIDRWIQWLDDFFYENTDLTIAMNRLFNENWVEFWNELEPSILRTFASVFRHIIDDIFEKVAYNDMFLPSKEAMGL